MGKGYNNYMCKKPFHPGSKANIKRAWMAEQKTENDKRKQDELKAQYEKEQDLYNNRALISSESKDKLELNFMYEAPPGAKREHQKEDDEPEFKFEWQRKYNAPREDYAKGNEDIKDQPFGIPVRNVRCIKCHKWGHINTDKECPLYNQASSSSMPTTSMDPLELMRQMKEDGYGLKEHVLGHQLNPAAANQQFIPSDDESDPEIDFLKSLSSAEKKRLLKKLKKLSKKQEKSSNCKKKKKSKKTRKSRSRASFSSDSEKERKTKKKKSKKSSSSDSDSSSDQSPERQIKKNKYLEPKEKYLKLEEKKSKEHKNSKEAFFKHQTREKYNRNMSDDDLNIDIYSSKKDKAHKKVKSEVREESSDDGKHKPMRTNHHSQEKYSKKTIEKDFSISRSELRIKSPDHNKHKIKESKHKKKFVDLSEEEMKISNIKKRGCQVETSYDKDSNLDRCATKKDPIHKKLRVETNDDYLPEKHKTKHDKKCVDSPSNKAKHFSSTSNEERYQTAKTETSPDQIELHASKRKKTYSHEYSNLDRCVTEENSAHKKVTSEKLLYSSEHSKQKFKETFHDVRDSQIEKNTKRLESNFEQEKLKAIETETFPDDAGLPTPKRKQETSQSDDSLNNSNTKMVKYDHPDGFSHVCPQARIKANYLQPNVEYEGKIHDQFRHHHRNIRSPSVKQKYNK